MKALFLALISSAVWAAGVSSQTSPSATIPKLTAPSGASLSGSGGSGGIRGATAVGKDFAPSAHAYYRLLTDLPASSLIDHYQAQLVAGGWRVAFKQSVTTLAVVRFSVGSPTDQLVGTIIVMPFPVAKQAMVSVRLASNQWPWAARGRAGGGGAGASRDFPVRFASRTLQFPPTVTRIELGGGGGTSNYMLHEMRLQALLAPAALMTHLESQLPTDGWKLESRIGDPVQAIIRRSSMPDPETDTSEVWMLTTMPGTNEFDAVLIDVRTRRGKL